MAKPKRRSGLDLYKILAMLMVAILHTLGQGGVLAATSSGTLEYGCAWTLECAAYCAVDCFALCTGYLCLKARNSFSKLLETWVQLFFYSAVITLLFFVFDPATFSLKNAVRALLPVSYTQWWYMSGYFGMFLLIPVLNAAIERIPKRIMLRTLVIVGAAFTLTGCLPGADPFKLNAGYCMAWLCTMYLFGAYFKKYGAFVGASREKSLLVYVGAFAFMVGSKLVIEAVTAALTGTPQSGGIFISYTSPFTVICCIALFSLFLNLDIQSPRLKEFVSSAATVSLGVYIIHTHQLCFSLIIKGAFAWVASLPALAIIPVALCCAAAIYAICSVIDWVRLKLFDAVKVGVLCGKVASFVGGKMELVLDKLGA